MNPEYERLGELAKQTVIRTMQEGEQTHPGQEWLKIPTSEHYIHAQHHMTDWYYKDTSEDHIGHAITRLVMILSK
jgi:hypothetical protein